MLLSTFCFLLSWCVPRLQLESNPPPPPMPSPPSYYYCDTNPPRPPLYLPTITFHVSLISLKCPFLEFEGGCSDFSRLSVSLHVFVHILRVWATAHHRQVSNIAGDGGLGVIILVKRRPFLCCRLPSLKDREYEQATGMGLDGLQ